MGDECAGGGGGRAGALVSPGLGGAAAGWLAGRVSGDAVLVMGVDSTLGVQDEGEEAEDPHRVGEGLGQGSL